MGNNRVLKTKDAVVTSKYGSRTVNGIKGFHYGNDIVGSGSTADYIVAHSDGTVLFWQNYNKTDLTVNGTNKAYGNCVKLKHPNGYYTLYAHMASLNVANGASVKKGQIIGYMGNTGYSLGTHLHFEVRNKSNVRIDPNPYLNADLPDLATSSTPKAYLSYGDTGDGVGEMQTMLIACGYSCGASGADKSFGNATLTALKAFQKDNGLEIDGNYGDLSKAKLTAVYATINSEQKDPSSDCVEKAISQMELWANDDTHGYDQTYRWGQKGDYDCSAAVIQAWENAGVLVKTKGATYTGNMYNVFLQCGFKDVTSTVNLANGIGCLRGDVLLNKIKHTAMYCGNGKEVEASINEKGTATGGTPGDQTGKEFLVRAYRNYPWDCVLRYGDGNETSQDAPKQNAIAVDGSFGSATVKLAQKVFGTVVDGVVSNQPSANKKYLPAVVSSVWQFKTTGYKGGSSLILAIQKKIGATVDGYAGKNFVLCLQKFLKSNGLYNDSLDGYMGTNTIKAFQTWLNKQV